MITTVATVRAGRAEQTRYNNMSASLTIVVHLADYMAHFSREDIVLVVLLYKHCDRGPNITHIVQWLVRRLAQSSHFLVYFNPTDQRG